MKRISVTGIFLLIYSVISYCDPFDGNYNQYGLPFLVFNDPSLIVAQKGTPAAVQVSYLSPQNYLEYKGAVLFPFGKNAFALGYVNGENPDHRVVTAYSIQQRFFLFGTSFSVVFAPVSPSLTEDAAISLDCLKTDIYLWFIIILFTVQIQLLIDTVRKLEYLQVDHFHI